MRADRHCSTEHGSAQEAVKERKEPGFHDDDNRPPRRAQPAAPLCGATKIES